MIIITYKIDAFLKTWTKIQFMNYSQNLKIVLNTNLY